MGKGGKKKHKNGHQHLPGDLLFPLVWYMHKEYMELK